MLIKPHILNSRLIPANKGRSTDQDDLSNRSIQCVYRLYYVCVGRVLLVTHMGSLALHNVLPKLATPGWG